MHLDLPKESIPSYVELARRLYRAAAEKKPTLPRLYDVTRRIFEAGDETAALEAIDRHRPPTNLAGLEALDAVALADLHYLVRHHGSSGDHESRRWLHLVAPKKNITSHAKSARRLYRVAAEKSEAFHWPCFQLGRLASERGDLDEAAEMLSRAASLEPTFPWSWYELAHCRQRQDDMDGLEQALSGFLQIEWSGPEAGDAALSTTHIDRLTILADRLYVSGHRDIAWRVYDFLSERGHINVLGQVRRGERFLSVRDYGSAIKLLESLGDTPGDWGLRALAHAYQGVGRHGNAASVLSRIVARNPDNPHFLRDYIMVQLKLGQLAEGSDRARAFDLVHALIRDYVARHGEDLEIKLHRLNVALARQAWSDAKHQLASFTDEEFAHNIELRIKRLRVAFARQAWPDAERQLASFTDEEFADNIELRVKRFEYLCFTRDLQGAAAALATLGPPIDLPAYFVPAVLRFYAETNAWRELYELGIGRLADSFDYGQTGYILFRAIRKTRSHLTALTEIERIEGWEANPSLRKLRTIVMEDLVHNGDMLDEILEDPNAEYTEALQNRLFFKMRVLRGPNAAGKDYAIYYCSNNSYFCATAVSITSLVENNRELMADAALFVAVDDHLVPFAGTVLNKLAGALGVEIHVLAASTLVRENIKFDTGYGLFTGGHSLADAAYYRIYMARYLMEQKSFERALYVDSDTIVLPGLERLFWMKGLHPLMARLEEDRPEVQTAIRLHGLEPGRYFNSGVLYFDLRNREVRSGLERTMLAVASPGSKLLFHDQCALNIGFAGAFSPLRQEFNHFVRLDTEGDVGAGVVVHFLDRPKPWDPAYPGAICRLWYTYWHKLSGHVGSQAALEMYRAANKD